MPALVFFLGGIAAIDALDLRVRLTGWPSLVIGSAPIWVSCLYGSVVAPRWRIWALRRVESTQQFADEAVASRLLWPPGHVLEKLEVKTRRIRDLERELGWHDLDTSGS